MENDVLIEVITMNSSTQVNAFKRHHAMCKFKFSLIMYASKMLRCLFYWIFYIPFLVRARNSATSRFINLNGCDFLSTLEYECCASVNIANSPQNQCKFAFYLMHNALLQTSLYLRLEFLTILRESIEQSHYPLT